MMFHATRRLLPAIALCAFLGNSAGAAPEAAPQPANASASTPSSICGNGLLEAGETCASCAADCTVRPCTAKPGGLSVAVSFEAPADANVLGVTVVLGYRSDRVSLPGTGTDNQARGRVTGTPADAVVAVVDRDYALRVVTARGTGIPPGPLFMVEFDSCSGAARPTAADFSCVVEGCSNVFGTVHDCGCTVAVP